MNDVTSPRWQKQQQQQQWRGDVLAVKTKHLRRQPTSGEHLRTLANISEPIAQQQQADDGEPAIT